MRNGFAVRAAVSRRGGWRRDVRLAGEAGFVPDFQKHAGIDLVRDGRGVRAQFAPLSADGFHVARRDRAASGDERNELFQFTPQFPELGRGSLVLLGAFGVAQKSLQTREHGDGHAQKDGNGPRPPDAGAVSDETKAVPASAERITVG